MKNNRRKQHLVSEINITPFTDVILVLLVIFMVTTPLISQSNIKVSLPKADSGKLEETKANSHAEITISREGILYLGGKIVNKKELKDRVKILLRKNSDLGVTVRADKFVRFQEMVSVLDILTELKITKLSIATANEK